MGNTLNEKERAGEGSIYLNRSNLKFEYGVESNRFHATLAMAAAKMQNHTFTAAVRPILVRCDHCIQSHFQHHFQHTRSWDFSTLFYHYVVSCRVVSCHEVHFGENPCGLTIGLIAFSFSKRASVSMREIIHIYSPTYKKKTEKRLLKHKQYSHQAYVMMALGKMPPTITADRSCVC